MQQPGISHHAMGEQVQHLAPKNCSSLDPGETTIAQISMTSEQVGIKSDTYLTSVLCAAIAADQFYPGLADL